MELEWGKRKKIDIGERRKMGREKCAYRKEREGGRVGGEREVRWGRGKAERA